MGALNVDATETNAFSPADLRLLVLMANEASRVLENMWMIQATTAKSGTVTNFGTCWARYGRNP